MKRLLKSKMERVNNLENKKGNLSYINIQKTPLKKSKKATPYRNNMRSIWKPRKNSTYGLKTGTKSQSS